jgi:hypothetical protein
MNRFLRMLPTLVVCLISPGLSAQTPEHMTSWRGILSPGGMVSEP